jgi:hypothetical protein
LASIDIPARTANRLRRSALLLSDPVEKQEMSQQLGTALDLGEAYGQIAARMS